MADFVTFFTRLFQKDPVPVMPYPIRSARSAEVIPEGITLVCNEDIYVEHSGQTVLLIKEGQAVDEVLLPKLIRYGVEPSQFRFEGGDSHGPLANPAMTVPGVPKKLFKKRQHRFLILDADERSVKRLTDCLATCGVPVENVHPVLVLDHLHWALQKHQPQVLFLDFVFDPEYPGLGSLLKSLQEYNFLKQIIVTMDLPPEKETLRKHLSDVAMSYGAWVAFKPINRFIIESLLEEHMNAS